jgi:hypothetical protein
MPHSSFHRRSCGVPPMEEQRPGTHVGLSAASAGAQLNRVPRTQLEARWVPGTGTTHSRRGRRPGRLAARSEAGGTTAQGRSHSCGAGHLCTGIAAGGPTRPAAGDGGAPGGVAVPRGVVATAVHDAGERLDPRIVVVGGDVAVTVVPGAPASTSGRRPAPGRPAPSPASAPASRSRRSAPRDGMGDRRAPHEAAGGRGRLHRPGGPAVAGGPPDAPRDDAWDVRCTCGPWWGCRPPAR